MSFSTEEALAFLAALNPSKMKFGLEPVTDVLAQLGNPERALNVIHVAGTNGKGSTCAFLDSCLRAHARKVGLYTSPHLVSVNERFRIDGEPISDAMLARRINEVLEQCPAASQLTYFEFGTVLAFWHFFHEKVEVVVLETGLGGRLDATNCCMPLVSVITAISIDHAEYLGNTVTAIASEKAGIIKTGTPVVISRQTHDALEVLTKTAHEKGAPLRVAGRDFELSYTSAPRFRGAKSTWDNLRWSLLGPFQRENAEVALGCMEVLAEHGWALNERSIQAGLLNTRWPGRLEWVSSSPPILVDGAHNPDGIRALLQALKTQWPERAVHLVFGVLADKDHRSMTQELFPYCRSIHLTPVNSPRAVEVTALAQSASGRGMSVKAYLSLQQALEGAKFARRDNDLILVCGSLVLVGELKRYLSHQ